MDPDASLEACRRLAARIIRQAEESRQHHESKTTDTLAEELAENFSNLDNWIKKGGFLPADWRRE